MVLTEELPSSPRSAAGVVSFGAPENVEEDSLSLTAGSEWSDSVSEPSASTQMATSSRSSVDAELIRLLSQAVDELGIDWAQPEEPTRSRLDEWYLESSRRQPSSQRPAPFFPEVHDEIAKSW
ncbi:MAG: hypothetical protein ACRDC4_01610, partial [Plesiomonas sp.]